METIKYKDPGHPKSFESPDQLWNEATNYFEWCDQTPIILKDVIRGGDRAGQIIEIPKLRPYTEKGFQIHCNISHTTWQNYCSKTGAYIEYFAIAMRIRDIIYDQKFSGAAVGIFNSSIIARDLGLKDSTDITSGGATVGIPRIIEPGKPKDE